MSGPEHLLHTLRSQGRFCGASGSTMYDELFELVARDVEAGGVFAAILSGHEDDPSREAVPLRLLGTVGEPINPEAHANYGLTLARLGRRAEAIQHLNLALQQRPDYPAARNWLNSIQAAAPEGNL